MIDETLPPLITTPLGHYRHYKGGLYEVVGTVRHSETLEPMTLYRALSMVSRAVSRDCGCGLRRCSMMMWTLRTV